jgi:hypothetical protein
MIPCNGGDNRKLNTQIGMDLNGTELNGILLKNG